MVMKWLRWREHKKDLDRELDEEIQADFAFEIQQRLETGTTPEEAQFAARRKFGNVTQVKEITRSMWRYNQLETLVQDLKYALRGMRRAPLFTIAGILSLAFGIGANTAIFSLLDQVILQALPVKHPEQLVLVALRGKQYGGSWGADHISYPVYEAFRDRNQVFSGMFCRYPLAITLVTGNHTERVDAELVSGSYFPVLGVGAALGRTLTPEDDRVPGGHPVAMLSYNFWQTRFASDRAILGKTLALNGRTFTVIGVAARDFDGVELGYQPQLFISMMMQGQVTRYWDALHVHYDSWITAFGRLKPGMNAKQANTALEPLLHSILAQEIAEPWFRNYSESDRRLYLRTAMDVQAASHGWSSLRQKMQAPLWILIGLTGAVLLLACANVANLLLARATSRRQEIAVRVAIGAGRRRIILQMLMESLLLSVFGALIGLALAFAADRFLLALYFSGDAEGQLAISANPDLRVLAFTICLTLLTAVLFGLAPAIQSARVDLSLSLRDRAATATGSVLVRKLLVSGQIALSLFLVVGAGLFLRSLANLRSQGPGFSTEHLLAFSVDPSLDGYDDRASFDFYRRLTENLQATPGVNAVGAATVGILENGQWQYGVSVEGYVNDSGQVPESNFNMVSSGYLPTLGVPLLAGRGLTDQDTHSVCLINETFARKYFAGRNPLGWHVGTGIGSPAGTEVVGIVKDFRYRNVRDDIPAQVFYPYLAATNLRGMTIYIRSRLSPDQMMQQARKTVRQIDPNIPVFDTRTIDETIDRTLTTERLVSSLSTLFGGLATLLALIGLYGVLAYSVARRTREIGIRIALGAVPGDVIWMVMREVLILMTVGVAAGVCLSLAFGSLARSQLYGLEAHDPFTLVSVVTALSLAAGLAGAVPALRASRVDPTTALRHD
jgi:predicted permease